MFEDLPSSVRDQFDNDPSLFLDYISDDERRAALINDKTINPEESDSGVG